MSLFSNFISATVKTALTPVAILKDGVNVITGEEPDATKSLVESAIEDVKDGVDDLSDGEIV